MLVVLLVDLAAVVLLVVLAAGFVLVVLVDLAAVVFLVLVVWALTASVRVAAINNIARCLIAFICFKFRLINR